MRIISQDGTIDIPYNLFSLSISGGRYKDVEYAAIYCYNASSPKGTKLAEYSSEEKAERAMKMLHEAYTGMPIIFQNVDLDDSVKKMFSDLRKNGVIFHPFKDAASKVEYVDNIIFRFPKDDEVLE